MMSRQTGTRTSITLLGRLHSDADQPAWSAFVERYAPMIYHWCCRFGLQASDAADVTQEVLLKLVGAMREFEYDPSRGSFRSWLKAVTGNAVRDLLESWKRQARGSGDTQVMGRLAAIEDPEAWDALTAEIERQYERELLSAAEQRVQPRVHPHTWRAYQMTAVDQQPPAQVATQLGITVAEVYVAKSRVIKMLRMEIETLEGD
jgi:RNA polymerase sigma-70 factor (ECF subfamily)